MWTFWTATAACCCLPCPFLPLVLLSLRHNDPVCTLHYWFLSCCRYLHFWEIPGLNSYLSSLTWPVCCSPSLCHSSWQLFPPLRLASHLILTGCWCSCLQLACLCFSSTGVQIQGFGQMSSPPCITHFIKLLFTLFTCCLVDGRKLVKSIHRHVEIKCKFCNLVY